jgi:hypothetical protein
MNKKVLNFLEKEQKQNVRLFKDKLGKDIILINNPSFVQKYAWKDIAIIDAETMEQIGKVQYSFSDSTNNRHIILHNIKVNNESGLHRGIGSYAIKFLEEITYNSFCNVIEGKYYPEAPATGDEVKKFYAKNGYLDKNGEPHQEGYEKLVYKYLMKEDIVQIINNTTINEEGYKVYGPIKNMSLVNAKQDELEA